MTDDRVDRVAAALELLSTMSGGTMPDLERLRGLRPDELADAESLYANGISASQPDRRRNVVMYAYLIEHAPGLTVAEGLASLSPAERDELAALVAEAS